MSEVQKVKLLLKIKIYLVPNLESTILRVLVTNVTHLYALYANPVALGEVI